jgi:hypothetical protein
LRQVRSFELDQLPASASKSGRVPSLVALLGVRQAGLSHLHRAPTTDLELRQLFLASGSQRRGQLTPASAVKSGRVRSLVALLGVRQAGLGHLHRAPTTDLEVRQLFLASGSQRRGQLSPGISTEKRAGAIMLPCSVGGRSGADTSTALRPPTWRCGGSSVRQVRSAEAAVVASERSSLAAHVAYGDNSRRRISRRRGLMNGSAGEALRLTMTKPRPHRSGAALAEGSSINSRVLSRMVS